jgi:thymidylate synthase
MRMSLRKEVKRVSEVQEFKNRNIMGTISDNIKQAQFRLRQFGIVRPNDKWQGIKVDHPLREVFNQYLVMSIPSTERELAEQTKADLPWAEDHFRERICGYPLNPGDQYKNWPYYKRMDNDEKFRQEGEGFQFSHSYMERFWPKNLMTSIRYQIGDLEDFIIKFRDNPHGRQHYFSIWHPEDQSPGDRRLPCTLGYYFQIIEGKLVCTYHIRSCDIYRHFHNDIYMAGRLMHWVKARLSDILHIEVGDLHMWIGSLHCFDGEEQIRN